MQSIITGPDDGARLRVVGDTVRVLASAAETGGAFEVFELEGDEGSGPPPHAHPWSEAYLVMEGEADVIVEGVKSIAGPGCFYNVPAGTTHTYRIRSRTAKFLVITSPGGAREFFTDVDAETDLEKIMAVAMKHGVRV